MKNWKKTIAGLLIAGMTMMPVGTAFAYSVKTAKDGDKRSVEGAALANTKGSGPIAEAPQVNSDMSTETVKVPNTAGLDAYNKTLTVASGTKWHHFADDGWGYISDGTLQIGWATIENPYAKTNQASYGRYYFNANGRMQTGWFKDPVTGYTYYLNPISDGTLGNMCMGWYLIDNAWYYFEEKDPAHLGVLCTNTLTPDGFVVNAAGQRLNAKGQVATARG